MSPKPTRFSKEALFIQRAKKAVLARDYQAAIRLYVRILKADPNNKDVLTRLAGVYVLAGDDTNALKIFTKILKNDPSNFKVLNSLSGIYRRMGKLEKSLEVINVLKKSGLNKDEVEFNAGYTYKLMGKYDEAISSFYNALEKNPGDVLAYNHIGSIEDLRGNKDKAIAAFSRGLQIDPNNPILHYNTAMHFAAQNQPEKAAQHFESALKVNAGWGDALNQYSDLLVHNGAEERAEELLLKNINLNPENTTAYNKLGQLYSRQKKYDEAEQMYLKVLDFDSENMVALNGLGKVYDRQKKYFDAAAILERLGKLQADDTETALRYAKILIELKRLQDAAVLLKKLYIQEPNNISLLNILAQYFVRSKDFKKAYVCFKRISLIAPDESDFLKENAVQFMYVKAFVNAEQLLESYVKKCPNDSEAWEILAQCYEARGLYKKALSALQQCMALDKNNFGAIKLLGNLSRSLAGDPKSMSIIADLLNKNINAEVNLDTLLNSMETRENILNHITKRNDEDESDSLPVEDENIDGVESDTKIEFFDDEEAEDDFMRLDFLSSGKNGNEEYLPLDLIDTEQIVKDEPCDLSDLLAPDMPVEYDRSRDGEAIDNPFDFPYSQKYDPSEEESFVDVDGTGFVPEDFEEDEAEQFDFVQEPQSENFSKNAVPDSESPRTPERSVSPENSPPDTDKPVKAPPLFRDPEDSFESLSAAPEPFIEKRPDPDIDIPPALKENPKDDIFTEEEPQECRQPYSPVEQEYPSFPENDSEDDIDLPLEAHEEPEDDIELPLEESEGSETLEESEESSEEENADTEEAEAEQENAEDDLTLDEELMRQMRQVLNHVFEEPPIKEFSRTFEMFDSLRGLCSYLPVVKKNEFFSDLNRVNLDYVIDRLEGKPGLLAAAEALHTRGIISDSEN